MKKGISDIYKYPIILLYLILTICFFYYNLDNVSLELFRTPLIYVIVNTFYNILSMIVNIAILNLFLKLGYKLVKKENLSDSVSITIKLVLLVQIIHLILQFYGMENINVIILAIVILFNPVLHFINYNIWVNNNCKFNFDFIKVSIPFYIYLILDFISIYMVIR